MSVSSIEFLLFVLVGCAVVTNLPGKWPKQMALAALNAFFLYLLLPDLPSLAALTAILLSGYFAGLWLRAHPSKLVLAGYLAALLAVFVVLKQYVFLKLFLPSWLVTHPIAIVGLSYMLFRQIHFVVDMSGRSIESPSLWTYANYQLSLFSLLSGPIQRYGEFQEFWQAPRPFFQDRHELLKTYLRILVGVIKMALIASACLAAYERNARWFLDETRVESTTQWGAIKHFVSLFYLYPAYIYFNFSGYCDIVIGAAALVGLRLPENFDRPYLARNMIDFWSRWHRTLSFWIRDYIFTPLYKNLAQRWPAAAGTLAIFCFFIALTLAGIWHGSTWNFVVFGLLQGIGVSLAKFWENRLLRKVGRQGLKRYLASPKIRIAATVANFHFVCVTFLFFPAELDQCLRLLTNAFKGML